MIIPKTGGVKGFLPSVKKPIRVIFVFVDRESAFACVQTHMCTISMFVHTYVHRELRKFASIRYGLPAGMSKRFTRI